MAPRCRASAFCEALDGPDLTRARELLCAELPSLKVSRPASSALLGWLTCTQSCLRYGRIVASWLDAEGRKSAAASSSRDEPEPRSTREPRFMRGRQGRLRRPARKLSNVASPSSSSFLLLLLKEDEAAKVQNGVVV